MTYPKPKIISFRETVSDIKDTGYITHSLYYHPAKFIPQIVRYCIKEYSRNNGITLDPFSGSGTTGLESVILNNSSYLLDINPLLDYFYPIKIPNFNLKELEPIIDTSKTSFKNLFTDQKENKRKIEFLGNLKYWYPEDLFDLWYRIWINHHNSENIDSVEHKIITLVLFKISKKYSLVEHNLPKLFISKRKRKYIENLERDNLESVIRNEGIKEINRIKSIIHDLLTNYPFHKKVEYYSGVDSYSFDYSTLKEYDCIITSPPYLQSQEYMRSFKLEMLWLGYSQTKIKSHFNHEIPFRKPEGIIKGVYIESIRKKIKDKKLLELFESYFWFTINTLYNSTTRLKKNGKICVLIGSPCIEGIEVDIWKVIYEHLTQKGFKLIELFDDKIVNRKLFRQRNNNNPKGMSSEYLLVMEKTV